MTVSVKNRRGKRVIVIDFRYKNAHDEEERYKRDATAATVLGAKEEEKILKDRAATTGSPFLPVVKPPPPPMTFGELATLYQEKALPQKKASTQHGYNQVLSFYILPALKGIPLPELKGSHLAALDEANVKLSKSSRNNIQIVSRSVLRWGFEKELLPAMPERLPKLNQPKGQIPVIPTEEQVKAILDAATPPQRLALALMAFGGLRPNEVRALKFRDLASPGLLQIREGFVHGIRDTPKTGTRTVPLDPRLTALLPTPEKMEATVAKTHKGEDWADNGLTQAFERLCKELNFSGFTVYALRHFAITAWIRAGIPLHAVMSFAGHSNLSTTQKYAHVAGHDLTDAAQKLAALGKATA